MTRSFLRFLFLLKLEYASERRKRSSIPSALLYLGCIFFILYQTHMNESLDADAVLSLYWVIQLFLSIWISFESMQSENIKRMLFWYQLIPVHILFLVKCAYNTILLFVFSHLIWAALCGLFLSVDFFNWELSLILSFAAMAFAAVFSFVAYMAFGAGRQLGLVGVLGVPLSIPLLIITTNLVKKMTIAKELQDIHAYQYLPFYVLLIALVMFSGVYLTPYIKLS